jgi:hypothetical protein
MANAPHKDEPTPATTSSTKAPSTDAPKESTQATAHEGGLTRVARDEPQGGPQATRERGKGAKPPAAASDTNTPIPDGTVADAPVSAPFGPLGKPIELAPRQGGRIRGSRSEDVDRTPASRNPAFYSKEAAQERARLTGDGSDPAAPTEPRAIGGGGETTAPVAATAEEVKTKPEDADKLGEADAKK